MKKTPPRAGEQSPAKRNRARRAATDAQVILSIPQAAALLGWTERATWQAAYRGMIPARRWGRKVFVVRAELLSFLQDRPRLHPGEGN